MMMKKNKIKFKLLPIFLIFILIISLYFIRNPKDVKAEDTESIYKNGDLRCPATLSSTDVRCVPKYDNNGNVIKIDIIYRKNVENNKYVEITKTVEKTKTLGEYAVSFFVKGNLEVAPVAGPAYITVIFDISATMNSEIKNAISALQTFATTLIPNSENGKSNYYLAIKAFNNNVVSMGRSSFKNRNFNSGITWPEYDEDNRQSYINKALKWASDLFENNKKKIPANANKYVLIFGDGNYWNDQSISKGAADSALNIAKDMRSNKKIKILGFLYDDGYGGYNAACSHYCGNPYGKMCTACCVDKKGNEKWNGNWIRTKQKYCNQSSMKNLTGSSNNYINGQNVSAKKWKDKLQEAAESIKKGTSTTNSYIELTDQIGDEFYKVNDTGRYKDFELTTITEKGQLLGSFNIEIDKYADPDAAIKDGLEKYWHKTNDNFEFNYTSKNESLQTLIVKDSPEVYWEPDKPTLDDCYDQAKVSQVRSADLSDPNSFYSKICYEGYDDKYGYRVLANVNKFPGKYDSPDNQSNFTLDTSTGLKFPTSIDLTANLICTYSFKVAEFNKKYNELTKNLNSATKESNKWYSYYTQIEKMNQILNSYKNLLNDNSDLKIYQENFNNQVATLKVTYDDSNEIDEVNLVNVGTPENHMDCSNRDSEKLYNGESIVTSRVCKVSLSKSMQLPDICLNMKTGDQENCSVDKSQLSGGNNFYVKLKEKGGAITLNIPKAGYSQKFDFVMDKNPKGKNACYYAKSDTKNGGDIMFRQIDVADPFLKEYNQKVGRNYLNEKFDFEKIIHSDTWDTSKEPAYEYSISKVNIANIRKDTDEDESSSYLGRNCKFTDDNKYICEFTRNIGEKSSSNANWWFFDVDGSEIK